MLSDIMDTLQTNRGVKRVRAGGQKEAEREKDALEITLHNLIYKDKSHHHPKDSLC